MDWSSQFSIGWVFMTQKQPSVSGGYKGKENGNKVEAKWLSSARRRGEGRLAHAQSCARTTRLPCAGFMILDIWRRRVVYWRLLQTCYKAKGLEQQDMWGSLLLWALWRRYRQQKPLSYLKGSEPVQLSLQIKIKIAQFLGRNKLSSTTVM